MTNQAFCLRRSNHLIDMVDDLDQMLKDENLVDVSLSCEDGLIKAHKIILSACSTYFRQIFSKVNHSPLQYPIIIIKDMPYQDLKYIIDFIYRGEVTVPQEHLNSVLKSAEALKIKGLANMNNQKTNKTSSDEHASRKKKKKRRKTESTSSSLEQEKNKSSNDQNKHINSSEDASEYSDEDEIHSQHHHQNSHSSHLISDQHTNLLQSSHHHNSPVINETEIEPSRLLEQTMITGDAQNISSIQSLASQTNNPNKYPHQYILNSVKHMMFDDSSGLIASQLVGQNEQNSNLALAQFDESIAGPSSLSLLPRQGEGLHGLIGDDSPLSFGSDQMLHTPTHLNLNISTQQSTTHQQSTISGGEEIITNNEDGSKPKRTYQCNFCLKRFDIRYSLQRHLKVIHNPARNLFTCSTCDKKFAWKSAFLRHVNVTCSRSGTQQRGTQQKGT